MAWIHTIGDDEADGLLKKMYEAAAARGGRGVAIIRAMSLNVRAARAQSGVYQAVMTGESPLTVALRELLAVIVSRLNGCAYCAQAHAGGLRAALAREWGSLSDAPQPADAGLDPLVHQAVRDWRRLPLRAGVAALAEFAEKLTLQPAECRETDILRLRAAGWPDLAVHDAVQVVAYLNYINRVAGALGVAAEPGEPAWGAAPSR